MRVISPRNLSPSITIATWPRSNTGSRASIGYFTSSFSSLLTMATETGSRKRASSP